MKRPAILFIQGGVDGAYKEDRKLVLLLREPLKDVYVIIYPRLSGYQKVG